MAERRLVARRTEGAAVADDVSTADQHTVTAEAREVTAVPVAIHRFRRLARKYQLYIRRHKPVANATRCVFENLRMLDNRKSLLKLAS